MNADLIGALGRWIGFAALLTVLGATVFRFGVVRATGGFAAPSAADAARRAAGLGGAFAVVAALAALLRLWAQTRAFLDPGEPITADLLRVVLGTAWGKGWTAQFLAAWLAGAGFFVARLVRGPGWIMAAMAASAMALAAPLTGHATASERAGAWGYPLEVLHILGVGAWLGTLTAVVFAGLPAARRLPREEGDRRIAVTVRAFSPVALTGAGTAVLAGVALAFRYLEGSLSALWTSGYGRALLLKVGVLAAVMAFGAWNWRVLTPTLGTEASSSRLRRSSLAELALGTVLLAVTAVLVNRPMPGEE